MKLSLIQFSPAWEDPSKSIESLNEILEKKVTDEEVLIFPEMSLTGFSVKSKELAEEIDGPSTRYFMGIARKYKKQVFAGIIEKDQNAVYNSLVHFDSMGLIRARYRKIHLFSFAGEEKFFSAGKEPVVTKINGTRFGLSVCYDLRFPELFRQYAKAGTEVLLVIANWPVQRISHWEMLLQARAIENQAYVIGVNRTGEDPYNSYDGRSLLFNPMGQEILRMGPDNDFASAEIDLISLKKTRKEFPFLQDIRLI